MYHFGIIQLQGTECPTHTLTRILKCSSGSLEIVRTARMVWFSSSKMPSGDPIYFCLCPLHHCQLYPKDKALWSRQLSEPYSPLPVSREKEAFCPEAPCQTYCVSLTEFGHSHIPEPITEEDYAVELTIKLHGAPSEMCTRLILTEEEAIGDQG